MALFWHGLFATAYGKLNHAKAVVNQTHTFRRHGLGKFAGILLELSRDPAMIFWLDTRTTTGTLPTKITGVSCWNCSPWASATTLRTT